MDFLEQKEKYTWRIYLKYCGKDKLKYDLPEYVEVDYSYVEYMNRRSNGAMFPLCGFKECICFFHSIESLVRIYETYKCYTAMYVNISERKYMYVEKLKSYDRDLEDLKSNGFKWNMDFNDIEV